MKNNTELRKLLLFTKEKGFKTPLRIEIMTSLNGSEEEKQKQVELFTSIVETSKTEEEAIQRVKAYKGKL